jgi:hypothetical protein
VTPAADVYSFGRVLEDCAVSRPHPCQRRQPEAGQPAVGVVEDDLNDYDFVIDDLVVQLTPQAALLAVARPSRAAAAAEKLAEHLVASNN